jgi:hypothetical protein
MKVKKETAPKPKKQKKERSSQEVNSMIIGVLALLFSCAGIAMLFLNLPVLVCAIFSGVGALGGFASLLSGKGGTLPAVVAIVAGFLCVLAVVILNASVY